MTTKSSHIISFLKKCSLLLFFILLSDVSIGQDKATKTRVLFIFDASQSMYAQWEKGTRMETAKALLSDMLDSLDNKENLEIALRVYGHQKPIPPQDCNDTRLEVKFGSNNVKAIQTRLRSLKPRGTTPIAKALEAGANDFPQYTEGSRNIVVLITDGLEECGGDPCAVSRLYQEKKIILKPFVIGIGLDEESKKTFDCVGTFYDAKSPETFKNVLEVVISQVLNSTTAQVNLLDINGKPTETNVPLTFYDAYSGILQYNFVHTMNSKGLPDTLTIDPVLSYNVVAHTVPPSKAKGEWKLTPGKHTIIPISAPQGSLSLKVNGNKKDISCIVRKKTENETLHLQEFNTKQNYLVGEYDLEILTLPRIKQSISINQSKNTEVIIPDQGLAMISFTSSGYGSIFEDENELKWVCDISGINGKQSFYLLPGKYRVIYRAKNASQTAYTKEKVFRVSSKKSVTIKL
jgi:Ca-activated chloride channel homolog